MLGKSYKNVYPEWKRCFEKYAYAESVEYFADEEDIALSDGFSLNVKSYIDRDAHVIKAELDVCTLTRNGEHVFNYRCTYNHGSPPCKGLIRHSNGRTYFPFQVDLYGISYLELDSGKVFNYIPEGFGHDISQYCGESFIITDIHYDRETNLVAYGGCYWAGPSDVMVGDLSDPLNFDPHLISIYEIIDPEYDLGTDIDFVRFELGRLIVKDDDNKEHSFDLSELAEKIKAISK